MNASLFGATVLIWGSTWIAIALQVGTVPVLVSVFYRFLVAAAVFLVVLAAMGRLRPPPLRQHPFILLQALCLFSLNFVCFYAAESVTPSGIVSLVFSLATIYNTVIARFVFGDPISGRVLVAAALGIGGLLLVLGGDGSLALDPGSLKGIGLAALGTLFFSLGNMTSRRNSAAGIAPETANAFGMAYGAAILLALIGLTGTPVVPPPDARYVAALLYLAVVGSVVGFTTYLVLVARVGTARAAYAPVLFPIVALALSTAFEGYRWHWTGAVGLVLTLLGNVVIFAGRPRPVRATRPA